VERKVCSIRPTASGSVNSCLDLECYHCSSWGCCYPFGHPCRHGHYSGSHHDGSFSCSCCRHHDHLSRRLCCCSHFLCYFGHYLCCSGRCHGRRGHLGTCHHGSFKDPVVVGRGSSCTDFRVSGCRTDCFDRRHPPNYLQS